MNNRTAGTTLVRLPRRAINWLRVKSPWLFLLTKKFFAPILFTRDLFGKNREVEKKYEKISFIIINNTGEAVNVRKKLGVFLFFPKKCSEIIIVSDTKTERADISNRLVKNVSSLSEAITISSGHHLCFIDDGEFILPLGLSFLKKNIDKKEKDIFWGRSIVSGRIKGTVLDQAISDNCSSLTLPTHMAFGPKVISRDLASKIRLPKGSVYSYMLSATKKSDSIFYIKRPIFYSKKIGIGDMDNILSEQKNFIDERYYFGKKHLATSPNRVLFIIGLKALLFNKSLKLTDTAIDLSNKNIKVDIFITNTLVRFLKWRKTTGLRIISSKATGCINKINEIDVLVKKNKYDIIHIIDNKYGMLYLPMSEKLNKRPYFVCDNFSKKKNYAEIIKKSQCYPGIILADNSDTTEDKTADDYLNLYLNFFKYKKPKFTGKITIAMLSYNRKDAIEKTLESIYKNSNLPFSILILDNGSDGETVKFLKKFSSSHDNISCIFEKKNLGCSGGRNKMLNMINSDYIVTIDNDMDVDKNWLEDMINRLNEDDKNVGVCAKCVMPNNKVQFTGGSIDTDQRGFALFNANDYGKDYDDLSTLKEYSCDWLPGGASMWRGDISNIAEHSLDYINAFEDFDYSLQIINKGYKIVNCPYVIFTHYHSSSLSDEQKNAEAKYINDRNNMNGFILSLCAFYLRTGMIMKHELIYKFANIPDDADPNSAKEIICSLAGRIRCL